MADAGTGHQGGDTEFEDQDLEAVAGPDTSSGLRDTPLALDQVIKGMKSMNVAWKIVLETKVIRMFPKISQLRRRPLLGPRNYHKGRAAIRHNANQTARPL